MERREFVQFCIAAAAAAGSPAVAADAEPRRYARSRLVDAHGAPLLVDAFHARGDLLMVGTFGDPQAQGSMAIFRTREGAEEFVADDPFVRTGVVKSWQIRQWNEALGGQL